MASPSSSSSSSSLLKTAALVAGGVAVAGAAYYAFTTLTAKPAPSTAPAKTTAPAAAPTATQATSSSSKTTASTAPAAATASASTSPPAVASSKTSSLDAKAQAKEFKKQGNALYTASKPDEAITFYTKAIDVYPADDKQKAMFYANRAACHMIKKDFQGVIEDCTSALAITPHYEKALSRRARAHENLGDKQSALVDTVKLCLLQPEDQQNNPQNNPSLKAMTDLVHKIAEEEAKDLIEKRPPSMIPAATITQYLDGFSQRTPPETESVEELSAKIEASPADGLLYYRRALARSKAKEYSLVLADAETAVKLLKEAKASTAEINAALMMEATFLHMNGRQDEAIARYNEILEAEPKSALALIKRGSAFLDASRVNESLADYNKAISLHPKDVDVYYHRGQLYFMTQDLAKAKADFTKACALNETSYAPRLQLAVTQFTLGDLDGSFKTFKQAVEKFPNVTLVHTLYGQVILESVALLEQHGSLTEAQLLERIRQALEQYDLALKIDPNCSLTLANKAQLKLRTAQIKDFLELSHKAIEVDPECETAYQQLAQFQFQQGNTKDALGLYDKVIDVARTMETMQAACAGRAAARAQHVVLEDDADLRRRVEEQAQRVKRQMEAMRQLHAQHL